MNPQNFWTKYAFKINQTLAFKAGYAEVLVKRVSDGWLVKKQQLNQPVDILTIEETADLPDSLDVFHFYTGSSNDLIVAPALPDKAVVFRNNKNLKISAGQSANLFFSIPLTMQFYSGEIKDENRMIEIPLKRLSDTWFGEIDNGEPAYSIGSNYYNSLSEFDVKCWETIAPVEIINNTSGALDLQRLILRVEEFNLFRKDRHILTNQVAIEFKGPDQVESVNLSVSNNIHGKNPELIAKTRLSDSKKPLRRSFFFIKNIYQN